MTLWLAFLALTLLVTLISFTAVAQAANGSRWLVGPAGAVLHAAPAPESKIIETLSQGRRLVEFERRGDWLRVLVMDAVGLEGWVPLAALSETAPSAPAEDRESPVGGETPQAPKPPRPIILAVSGSPALKFSADCSLVGSSGRRKEVRVTGLVPKSYSFTVPAVSCLVRKEDARGRLRARLLRDGRRLAAAETAAAYNHVRVRSLGPWGEAEAWRGSIPQIRFLPGRGGRGFERKPSVPPLGPVVPPLGNN